MELLKRENVRICKGAEDWQDAIRKSIELLEKHGYVEPRYKEEVIGNVKKLGPYILIADNIALPHARPEQGAIRTQVAVTLFRDPVAFENGESAQLFVTLAAADANKHIDALVVISELLAEESYVEQIVASATEDELYQYFA
ncbi:MAG: PTS sugar transporter subunit IIA [Eubacteriales bacterium]|nr:PTS sugar transporter subunit IIA [Eubacteriales bacterium]